MVTPDTYVKDFIGQSYCIPEFLSEVFEGMDKVFRLYGFSEEALGVYNAWDVLFNHYRVYE
jgi:hypothetical protein